MCKTQVYIVCFKTHVLYRLNKRDKNGRKSKFVLDKSNVEL